MNEEGGIVPLRLGVVRGNNPGLMRGHYGPLLPARARGSVQPRENRM